MCGRRQNHCFEESDATVCQARPFHHDRRRLAPTLVLQSNYNPPSLPPIAARSLLPRSISSKIRYGRSSAAEVLRSCPPRHCVPSSIPPSLRCEVMQVIFRYLVSHSKFWGESTADFISAERDFSDLGVEGRKRETEGGREGGEILTRVAKAR